MGLEGCQIINSSEALTCLNLALVPSQLESHCILSTAHYALSKCICIKAGGWTHKLGLSFLRMPSSLGPSECHYQ